MKLFNNILLITTLILGGTVLAKNYLKRGTENCPTIVGVFAWNEILTDDVADGPDFGQWTFNADGTLIVTGTDNFQRPYPHLPIFGMNGAHGSPYHGIWRKVGQRSFQIVAVSVISLIDFCRTNADTCPPDIIHPNNVFIPDPINPHTGVRTKATGTITLSKDGKKATGNLEFTYYLFADDTFSNPLPVGPLPSMINFTRLAFQ